MLAFVLVFNFFLFRIVDSDPLAKYRGAGADRGASARRSSSSSGSTARSGSSSSGTSRQTMRLDFGYSTDTGRPVWDEILELLPEHAVAGRALDGASPWRSGCGSGAKAGWRRGSRFDKVSTGGTMVLYAMPEFWLGMLLLVVLRRPHRAGSRPAASAT